MPIVCVKCPPRPPIYLKDVVVDQQYTLVDRTGEPPQRHGDVVELDALGCGTFGVVIRAHDSLGLPRVVKVLRPVFADVDEEARREVVLANARPFKHVVPAISLGHTDAAFPPSDEQPPDAGSGTEVTDVSTHDASYLSSADTAKRPGQVGFSRSPYFVSPFIDGLTLATWHGQLRAQRAQIMADLALQQRLHDAALELMDQLLAGLDELRLAHVSHMDLTPMNILLYCPNRAAPVDAQIETVFITDLGAAKAASMPTRERTNLITTRYYFPWHLLDALGPDSKTISREAVAIYGHAIDVYELGRVLESLFLDPYVTNFGTPDAPDVRRDHEDKVALWKRIFGDDYDAIEDIVRQMLARGGEEHRTAASFRRALAAVPRMHSPDMLASSVLTDTRPAVRVRVGRVLVRVSPPMQRVVEHPTFQRLRLIQQLALVSQVYPDGTHSRFAHSLRTFSLAKQALLALRRNSALRLLLKRQDVDTILAAALVHDLGQYHFSHTIEDLRKCGERIPQHEQWRTIAHDQERVRGALRETASVGYSISEVLQTDLGVDVEDLLYMVDKRRHDPDASAARAIGRDLVAGVIDVDRIAYLVHDSEKTGVPYGAGIDVGSLLEGLTIARPGEPGMRRHTAALAIEEGAVSAVEAVLAAVYWMYRNVYWHHTNRGFMAAVKRVVGELLEAQVISFSQYVEATQDAGDWEALRWLQQRFAEYVAGGGRASHNPLDDLVQHRRLGYRRVLSMRPDGREHEDLFDRLVQGLTAAREKELLRAISEHLGGKAMEPGRVLLDVPLKPRLLVNRRRSSAHEATDAESRPYPILVASRQVQSRTLAAWVDLAQYSPMVSGLGEQEEICGRRIRVYVHREVLAGSDAREVDDLQVQLTRVIETATHGW